MNINDWRSDWQPVDLHDTLFGFDRNGPSTFASAEAVAKMPTLDAAALLRLCTPEPDEYPTGNGFYSALSRFYGASKHHPIIVSPATYRAMVLGFLENCPEYRAEAELLGVL